VASAAPKKLHERIAIIDLGPAASSTARQKLAIAAVAAGLELVEGADAALAGQDVDADAVELASAIARAQDAFGKLDCKAAQEASAQAIGIAAARQAGGRAVPELPRALAYVLLCADRTGDVDRAMTAAQQLRAAGGSADVPADIWKKYPELDAVPDRDTVTLTITSDAPGAAIWVDFREVGKAPVTLALPVGDHVIAAAVGTRRGWAAGTAVKAQTQLAIPTPDRASKWSAVAQRIASWHGKLPGPKELGWVMAQVNARIAIVRHGDTAEVFGRTGLAEAPHRLGADDGVASIANADQLAGLIADRVQGWNDHAPDPDRPLLREDGKSGDLHDISHRDPPTRWWVYASVVGAVVAGALIVYSQDAGSDKQRVELHQP
jgi:hypothetical protein